jgi:prevent-host-death family protein
MKTITQRELRNDSAQVMRSVAQGSTYRVTHRGTPIAVLNPYSGGDRDELTYREGPGRMTFPPGVVLTDDTTDEALAELRGER